MFHCRLLFPDLLVDMLGVLASYNLTVRELKLFFSKLQGDKGQWVKKWNTLWYLKVSLSSDTLVAFKQLLLLYGGKCQIERKRSIKVVCRSEQLLLPWPDTGADWENWVFQAGYYLAFLQTISLQNTFNIYSRKRVRTEKEEC